ncbi:hypothetical protein EIP91_002099 [Steccherinum ochraceum]|uniref:Uncharacterized protein n=1 Tax=Steccherinum ochraceum TaxID=92696 RepID=A0A4R0RTK5_9APHY|nr:hypothetical protein EIP91_002099 [Steccherinum ochraceum]
MNPMNRPPRDQRTMLMWGGALAVGLGAFYILRTSDSSKNKNANRAGRGNLKGDVDANPSAQGVGDTRKRAV